jgi:hypothetical protein
MISRCSTYPKSRRKQQREPMQPLSPATEAWTRVATDLFKMQGNDYLLVVDYHTNYPEIPPVVIKHTKSIFARYGHFGSCYIGQRSAICRQGISRLCIKYINDMILYQIFGLGTKWIAWKSHIGKLEEGSVSPYFPSVRDVGGSKSQCDFDLKFSFSKLYYFS